MPNLSKNFFYNILLTISGYVFPLLTFPYVTRVLGPEGLGKANFVLGIVDYAVLFSSLGLGTIGIREIAKCSEDKEKLNRTFSQLLTLHLFLTIVISVVYFGAVICVPELRDNFSLYAIGFCKLLFNAFLIEWLFTGLQDFKYITIRTMVTRLIYVALVFLFVRENDDIMAYVVVTVAQVILNAIINWRYCTKVVTFTFRSDGVRMFFKPVLSLGINLLLLSFYSTFITLYLGFVCSDESIGYFTTSTKIYAIILSILSAFNGALMPYLNSLYGQGKMEELKSTINKSLLLVLYVSLPVTTYCFVMSEDVITLIAGAGYERAILPFRLIIIQVVLVGLSQITELQILLTYNKLKQILFITLCTTLMSVGIMVFFAPQYAELAAAYAVLIPHILECTLLLVFAYKCIKFNIKMKSVVMYAILSVFVFAECFVLKNHINGLMTRLIMSFIISGCTYFGLTFIFKDQISLMIKSKLHLF